MRGCPDAVPPHIPFGILVEGGLATPRAEVIVGQRQTCAQDRDHTPRTMRPNVFPTVLGFLLVLEAQALPETVRMRGWYRWLVWSLSGLVIAFGLFTAVWTVFRLSGPPLFLLRPCPRPRPIECGPALQRITVTASWRRRGATYADLRRLGDHAQRLGLRGYRLHAGREDPTRPSPPHPGAPARRPRGHDGRPSLQ